MKTKLNDGTEVYLGEGVPAMKPVYVVNREEACAVHGCNSVQEAEEWLVDNVPPDQQDDITIEATGEALLANHNIAAEPESTDTAEVDAIPPLNHIDRLRHLVERMATALEDGKSDQDTADLVADANEALEVVWGGERDYPHMPELREFDEIVSQGREQLIDWIENGRRDPDLVSPTRHMDAGVDVTIARPMSQADTVTLLRKRANSVLTAVGWGAASFAVPGLRAIMERLDLATKVISPEEIAAKFGDGKDIGVAQVMVTLEQFELGQSTMHRDGLQLVAG